jgi:hypothetical protein
MHLLVSTFNVILPNPILTLPLWPFLSRYNICPSSFNSYQNGCLHAHSIYLYSILHLVMHSVGTFRVEFACLIFYMFTKQSLKLSTAFDLNRFAELTYESMHVMTVVLSYAWPLSTATKDPHKSDPLIAFNCVDRVTCLLKLTKYWLWPYSDACHELDTVMPILLPYQRSLYITRRHEVWPLFWLHHPCLICILWNDDELKCIIERHRMKLRWWRWKLQIYSVVCISVGISSVTVSAQIIGACQCMYVNGAGQEHADSISAKTL